jgi:hypothetical protein
LTPEKKFEQEIISELTRRGWFAHHFDANGVDGWPDILALKDGQYILIEVKCGSALRKEQTALHMVLSQSYAVDVFIFEYFRKKESIVVTYKGNSYGCLMVDYAIDEFVLKLIKRQVRGHK